MRPQDIEHLTTTPLDWDALWDETEQRYRVQTREGQPVQIYTINGKDSRYPVVGETCSHGVASGNDNIWIPRSWARNGKYEIDTTNDEYDLIPEPRTVKRWVNVYKLDGGKYFIPQPHETKSDALTWADKDSDKHLTYIETVSVEWTE